MSLEALGWNPVWNERFTAHAAAGREPARVSGLDRDRCSVLTAIDVESTAEVAGRLRHEARSPADYPAVGDWVALDPGEGDGPRRIAAVLPRSTAVIRKEPGRETAEQVIAANVDTAFVVSGLDGDFNLRRLERFLAAVWDSGATPVVVLNKADLCENLDEQLEEARATLPGATVLAISATRGDGLGELAPWLEAGRTVVLLGSSGAGKSTLANALLGEERQLTGGVRVHDSRGRHTTTRRELIALPGGAWLLDTPGLRVLELWGDEDSLDQSFPEIAALAAECRFRDCQHDSEPGCAVLRAEREGTLPPGRISNWRKLQRELRWLAGRQDQRIRLAEQARWKSVSKAMRQREQIEPRLKRNR